MRRHTNNTASIHFFAAACSAAILLSPVLTHAETPFEASRQFIETGQITEARRALESELRMRPDNIEARYNLAVLLEEGGHQSDAMQLYEKNLSITWHLPSLVNLASALERKGDTSRVIQWLEKGTRHMKHEATPWYLLASISEKRGDTVSATIQYNQAIKADPLNGFAYLNHASFQSRQQLGDMGLKHGAKAIRLLPQCAPCWKSYASILKHAGKGEASIEAYQHSLALNPDINTRRELVGLLRKLGYLDRAEQMQRGINSRDRSRAK
ncbi:Tetratricopeptide repeat-containing protein [Mariprofundus ferrinatatus]|uniref:Tetratricopeptide repeat-containing protein n=1 Tax=Mariprofundus ferrinatatus TaxID=1921087 RepID=A0A2K8L268_9PROT|nr:tetratricopeptide repeat protein [Mariprofundus ferrinatatus]ATX81408.1 Tetratricopeptide repeat-containing protein [Mariprofundus ferrinatatus]